jgi:hypothetical protein
MNNCHPAPSTQKVRRDALEGKRGDGWRRLDVLRRPDPNAIHLAPDDTSLTAVAGLVPFGQFLRREGVDAQLRRCFGAMKVGPMVRYGMPQQIRMLIDAAVTGAGRVFDLEALAADPLFVRLAGGCVCSIDTVYDDLRRFDDLTMPHLDAMVSEHGLAPLRALRLAEVHVDIDTTVEPVFGEYMEGAVPGPNPRYHGRPNYHPILMTIAETRTVAGIQLRPGDTSLGEGDAAVVRRWLRRVREAVGPQCTIWVRIDSGGDCAELLKAIDDEPRCLFVVKAKIDPAVHGAITRIERWKTVDRDADERPTRQAAEVPYERGSWAAAGLKARMVAVRERDQVNARGKFLWEDLEWSAHAYVTNAAGVPADDIAHRYQGRAEIEPMIAELKGAWSIGQIPTQSFAANEAMLRIKVLSYNLMRRYVAKHHGELAVWRTPWQRIVLIRIPGRLVYSGRQWRLHTPPHTRRMLN